MTSSDGPASGQDRPADLTDRLRTAYDAAATTRDTRQVAAWKTSERQRVLDALANEKVRELLEIGAGTGRDAAFFSEAGFEVFCVDISPVSVALCQEKGLDAAVMDFASLSFDDQRFDAVYALNCLLHVPDDDLPCVLREIHRILRRQGLFYFGTYGGVDRQGIYEADTYRPRRFFSFRSERTLRRLIHRWFEVVWFHTIEIPGEDSGLSFQSLLLRKSVEER